MKTPTVRTVRTVPGGSLPASFTQGGSAPIRTMGQWYLVCVFYMDFYRVFYSKPLSRNGSGQWWTVQDRGRA